MDLSTPSVQTTQATFVNADGTLGFGQWSSRRPGPLRTNPIRPETSEGCCQSVHSGDLIGPDRNCNALLQRLRKPRPGDITPECIYGWWEDQLLAEHGYRGERHAESLRREKGDWAVTKLMNAVDGSHLNWLASLQFGFIELDCALIHGSSADGGSSNARNVPANPSRSTDAFGCESPVYSTMSATVSPGTNRGEHSLNSERPQC